MPRILMVASEAAPFVKTGGLADVLGALPAALVRQGEEIAVVLPRYASAQVGAPDRIWNDMPLWLGPRHFVVGIDQIVLHGVRYLFADCPPLYDRPGIYNERGVDYPDNHIRFALLNQAALSVARNIFRPDIFHVHDWQGGLLPAYLRGLAGDPTFFGVKSILTIHNLGYQGNFPGYALGDLGIAPAFFQPEGLESFGEVSFLKGGIVFADAITTVSPTYAREIQTPEHGFGFDGQLRSRAATLTGILNGVDYDEWNPETDPHLAARYSAGDLSGKRASKLALLEEMGLPSAGPAAVERPLIGIVSRFADQKGMDLVTRLAGWFAGENVALAVLGSGDAYFEEMFSRLARLRPDQFGVRIGYDNTLAHRIEAGADMLLMPSRYEPSGLNQMYSLRYGTVPIVRATGGLADTVDGETGFTFEDYSPEALAGAIGEALGAWQNREKWVEMMRRGMAKDYSWEASAARYRQLYRSL